MAQLFQHKWTSTAGDYRDDNGYSDTFLRWAAELNHFDDKDWKKAYTRIEGDIKQAARLGDEIWPPSSVEVVAFAEPFINSGMYKTFDRSTALEDHTKKAERKELGKQQCAELLSRWD